jgi:hypothetical protein
MSLFQVCLLTGLTSQLGIAATLLLHQRPLLQHRRRLAHLLVFTLAAGGPTLIVAALAIGCAFHHTAIDTSSSWWLLPLGGYHFISYLAVLGVLFLLLVLVMGTAWRVLSRDGEKSGGDADPGKISPLAVNMGTLQRAALIAICLMAYNAVSVVFANGGAHEEAHSEPIAVSFGLTSALLGMVLLFCYILRSESYVIIWCGTNKVSEPRQLQTHIENKLQLERLRQEMLKFNTIYFFTTTMYTNCKLIKQERKYVSFFLCQS